ncbi:MAG: hypothetical protein ACR2GH_21430 [Pseudonocardia sp.]
MSPSPSTVGPLEQTQRRLRVARPEYPHVYTVGVGVPDGSGWLGLHDALPSGALFSWWETALRRENPALPPTVAAVRVVGMLARVVLSRLTAALVLDRRAHDVSATNLLVHLDEDGRADRVAVRRPTVAVLPGDIAAGAPDTIVAPDLATLLDAAAAQAVATLTPMIDAVHALSRFGVVPAWNVAADAVLGTATFVPLYLGGDERAGRALGEALLDALVARGARIGRRGTCEAVVRGGSEFQMPVRGSCCFSYRTDEETSRPGDQYCTTCPLLDVPTRARRFGVLLDTYVLPRWAGAPTG